jgi:hypothetical protein
VLLEPDLRATWVEAFLAVEELHSRVPEIHLLHANDPEIHAINLREIDASAGRTEYARAIRLLEDAERSSRAFEVSAYGDDFAAESTLELETAKYERLSREIDRLCHERQSWAFKWIEVTTRMRARLVTVQFRSEVPASPPRPHEVRGGSVREANHGTVESEATSTERGGHDDRRVALKPALALALASFEWIRRVEPNLATLPERGRGSRHWKCFQELRKARAAHRQDPHGNFDPYTVAKGELPNSDTWTKYVRDALKLTQGPRNSRRHRRPHGESICSKLDADDGTDPAQ